MLFQKNQKENKRFHGIHITHNDADAVGCALVLSYFHPSYDYEKNTYFCAIGTQDKKVLELMDKIDRGIEDTPQSIVISDLSLSEETCDRLEDFCEENGILLKAFDHHSTNHLNKDYDWWDISHFPIKRFGLKEEVFISSTVQLYNKYSIGDEAEYILPLVWMISDYDTWTWRKHPQLYHNNIVNADIVGIVCSVLKPEKMFKELYEYYCDGKRRAKKMMFPDLFYTLYEIETENRDRYLKSIIFKTQILQYRDVCFGMFISENGYANAAAEYLYNNYECIDIVMVLHPTTQKVSFRTKRDDINVAEIAKKYYNGGGHPTAAGGVLLKPEEFVELLEVFYIQSTPLTEYLISCLK